ncbi:MAG: cobalt transporter CbiM [Theionarchaea archaeon]|nr:cobalt transporter CbiM [Theionarchaea archaeon]
MHIPDGFLSMPVVLVMWIITILVVGYSIKRTNKQISGEKMPLMGVLAAFVFAAQMLNVPVAAGTSGHFLGGVLVAIFLGPWAGTVIMATVFIVQAVLFQDGGILALGANIFNMGLIGTVLGYYLYRGLLKTLKSVRVAAMVAAWTAIVLASVACAVELAASGTSPLNIVVPAMAAIHAVIGIIEAVITVVVISAVMKTRPDLLPLEVRS